jgi:hypothetical protein
MTITIAKPQIGQKKFMDLTKEEMEGDLAKATRQAQANLHAQGLPYIIGDTKGTYAVYPDGKRIFTPYRNKINAGR